MFPATVSFESGFVAPIPTLPFSINLIKALFAYLPTTSISVKSPIP
jgi:hypothetical protein